MTSSAFSSNFIHDQYFEYNSHTLDGLQEQQNQRQQLNTFELSDLHDSLKSLSMATYNFDEDDFENLKLLRGQEIDEIVEQNLLPSDLRFDEEVLNEITISHPEIVLRVQTGRAYPAEQLSYKIENLSLPRLVVDPLKTKLRLQVEEDTRINNYETWADREADDAYGVFQFKMTALKIIQITATHLKEYRNKETGESANKDNDLAKTLQYKNDHISLAGVDISTLKEDASAATILGKSLEDICAEIPEEFRVLHIESVLRSDLKRRFWNCQQQIRDRLQKLPVETLKTSYGKPYRISREDLIDHLIKPCMTFHGTTSHIVKSIVQHGFLRPGDRHPETGGVHYVRCGNTYGRGIYSSPSADFALSYSGDAALPTNPNTFFGMKLIVCAAIMGRQVQMFRKDNWRNHAQPYPGADSHVANANCEYIVFDQSQIIPCYVMHLDYGKDNFKYFESIPEDSNVWQKRRRSARANLYKPVLAPGDKVRRQEALKAKAMKWFPYGYGSATGTNFKIEEISEVSEDDEDYGDYQEERLEGVDELNNKYQYDTRCAQTSEQDEYVEAKLVHVKVKKEKKVGNLEFED